MRQQMAKYLDVIAEPESGIGQAENIQGIGVLSGGTRSIDAGEYVSTFPSDT